MEVSRNLRIIDSAQIQSISSSSSATKTKWIRVNLKALLEGSPVLIIEKENGQSRGATKLGRRSCKVDKHVEQREEERRPERGELQGERRPEDEGNASEGDVGRGGDGKDGRDGEEGPSMCELVDYADLEELGWELITDVEPGS
ncbi:hypothetical protein K440DRAFT_610859 [Wilcoxina mikolae CBS 423.85]|nr:hypothetical protein K440DRAFT_610859 [Wilcoxina mikolae CBS 423.85]